MDKIILKLLLLLLFIAGIQICINIMIVIGFLLIVIILAAK